MARPELLERIADRIDTTRLAHPIRVGIDGVDAAGKTTLGDELAERLRELGRTVIRSGVDHFHHPASVRYRRGPDSAEGYFRDSFDLPGLVETLLAPLGPDGMRRYRTAIFDYRTDAVVDEPARVAPLDAILVFDGVFLHRPELVDYWDVSLFLEVDPRIAIERAITRDASQPQAATREALRRSYEDRYHAGQRIYRAECRPTDRAHLIIDHSDFDWPRLLRSR